MNIEQKAREIAESVKALGGGQYHEAEKAARLGIIEGLEMAAKWHDDMMEKSDLAHEAFHQICGIAIRALIEEQKL